MKSFAKFLLLLLIVALIVYISWRVLDNSLFNDGSEHIPAPSETSALSVQNPKTPAPAGVTDEQAFQSTSAENANARSEAKFGCKEASKYIANLYDLYHDGKNKEQLEAFINDNADIPEDQINSFLNFVNTLTSTDKEQLPRRQKFLKNFQNQCSAAEHSK